MRLICIGLIVGDFTQLMAESPSPSRDIDVVIARHSRQLLDLPDVVDVGVLSNIYPPRITVILARPNPETESKIPREIEGYRVVTRISGEFYPQ